MAKIIRFPKEPETPLEKLYRSIVPEYSVIAEDVLITQTGLPVFLMDRRLTQDFVPPSYDELEKRCAEYTFRVYGQSYLITDVLVRDGYCNYSTAPKMKESIIRHLEKGIILTLNPK